MTTTPVRRLAAGATTALLALGLLTPAALAVADDLPVEDQTTTVLDETATAPASEAPATETPTETPAETPAEEASAEELPHETPEAPAESDDGAASAPPAPAEEPTEPQAKVADASENVTSAAPAAVPAGLAATPELGPGESRTETITVTEGTVFPIYALGDDVEVTSVIPGTGGSVTSVSVDGVNRHLRVASSPVSGTMSVTVRNLADETRVVPFVASYYGPVVRPDLSPSLHQPYLFVSLRPTVDGTPSADITGQVNVIGRDGVTHSVALRPQTAGSTSYYARFEGLEPGLYLIEAQYVMNGVSYSAADLGDVVAEDDTPPVVAYTTEPAASNAHGWFRRAVTATLAASDPGSGVQRIFRGLDTTTLEPVYGTTTTTVEVATEGVHALRYYAEDYQNNASAQVERTIRIDLTAPTATLDGLVDGQEIREGDEVIVDYSCDDALSGIVDCIAPIESGEQLDTSTPGVFTFTLVAVDRAGNETRVERTYTVVGVDTTAPSLDVDLPEEPASGWFTEPVTLQFSASDLETGISRIHWEYGTGSGVVIGESTTPTGELELDATGEYEVEVWAEDGAGNRSETQTFTVRVDVSAPVIRFVSPADPIASILPNGHYAQNERVVIDIDCTDEGSGLASCDASTPDGEYLPTGRPGTHELRVVATDAAGNRTERVLSYTVDAPTASGGSGSPTASRDPRLAQTGADYVLPGIVLVAVLLAAGATLLTTRRLGGR